VPRQVLELGSCPYDEDGADITRPGFAERAKRECAALIEQIRRQFGPEPPGTELKTQPKSHEAGTYYEVVVEYGDEDGEAYALRVEDNLPARWDEEAKRVLEGWKWQ